MGSGNLSCCPHHQAGARTDTGGVRGRTGPAGDGRREGAPPRRTARVPDEPPGPCHPGRGGPAGRRRPPPHPGPAPRGGSGPRRGRRLLVPVAGAGPRHHRLAAGAGLRRPRAAAQERRAPPSVRAGRAEPAAGRGRSGRRRHVRGADPAHRRLDAVSGPHHGPVLEHRPLQRRGRHGARHAPRDPAELPGRLLHRPRLPRADRGELGGARPAGGGPVPGGLLGVSGRRRLPGRRGGGEGGQRALRRTVGAARHRPRRAEPQGGRAPARRPAGHGGHPAAGAGPAGPGDRAAHPAARHRLRGQAPVARLARGRRGSMYPVPG